MRPAAVEDTVGYSTVRMPDQERIRVAATLPAAPADWHVDAIDAVRGVAGVDLLSVERVEHDRLDVLIDLAGVESRQSPRYGVWRYGFGDGAPVADGAAGTRARLYRATGDPARAVVLHEGWFRARTPEGWGTASVGDRVAPWCARALRQITLGHSGVVGTEPQSVAGCCDPLPPVRRHGPGAAALDTIRDWLRRERWTIGIVPLGIDDVLQHGALPEPSWLVGQPADRFYADPFLLGVCGDHVRVVVEDYRYASRRKGLAELHVGMNGELLRSADPAGLPLRASYPFLLRHHGNTYCLPETFRAHRLSVYTLDQHSGAWTFDRDVLQGFPCVDGTLLERDGRWWLFCTKQGDEDQTDLHLFFADRWSGPWQPHPLNPVKSDTRSSRPAGACFEIGGSVYRPAQNCARRYGAGIAINRLVELTPTAFREETVLLLRPSPSSSWRDGMHTINSAAGVTVVDGLRVERRWGHLTSSVE